MAWARVRTELTNRKIEGPGIWLTIIDRVATRQAQTSGNHGCSTSLPRRLDVHEAELSKFRIHRCSSLPFRLVGQPGWNSQRK